MSVKRILGVDPGSNHHALTLIELNGTKISLVDVMWSEYKGKKLTFTDKLLLIHQTFEEFFERNQSKIDVVSFETQYLKFNNVTVLRILSQAVGGMKLSTLLLSDAEIYEFTPNEMKLALTGDGSASKEDMASAARRLLGLKCDSPDKDEADALAAAIAYILFTPEIIVPILEQAKEQELADSVRTWKKLSDSKRLELKKNICEKVLVGGILSFTIS